MSSQKPVPKVIVGLLNWNEIGYTVNCIESLEKLNYKNFEIVVLDNGSRKDSVNTLKIIEKQKRIKLLLEKENIGFTGGNNKIINYVLKNEKFDYLLLLNNDTLVEKDFLKKQVSFMEKNLDAGVAGPKIMSSSEELSYDDLPGNFNFLIGGSKRFNWIKMSKQNPFSVGYVSGCSWLIKKEVLQKTRGFAEKYFIYNEEVEWAYRINEKKYKFFLIPDSVIVHLGHATTGKISGFQLFHQIRNTIWFEKKYASRLQCSIFLIYLLFYKIPKNIIKVFLSKKDIKQKMKRMYNGVYEGLFAHE